MVQTGSGRGTPLQPAAKSRMRARRAEDHEDEHARPLAGPTGDITTPAAAAAGPCRPSTALPPPASAAAAQRAWFVQLFCYITWLALLYAGAKAYEGERILVKSKNLPLHWFDVLFRRTGALLLFAAWAGRATAAHLYPATWLGSWAQRRSKAGSGSSRSGSIEAGDASWRLKYALWWPVAIYLIQTLLRMVIYQLHVAGLIFSPQRFARDNQTHPPHVMSDHILLGAAVHAGLASEAALAMLSWDAAAAAGRPAALLVRAYSALTASLAALVSAECYFTARYFHPPGEIFLAAIIGAAIFQVPLLAYARWAFRASTAGRRTPAGKAAGAIGGRGAVEGR